MVSDYCWYNIYKIVKLVTTLLNVPSVCTTNLYAALCCLLADEVLCCSPIGRFICNCCLFFGSQKRFFKLTQEVFVIPGKSFSGAQEMLKGSSRHKTKYPRPKFKKYFVRLNSKVDNSGGSID